MPTKNPEGEILYATTGTEAGAIIEALENAQPYAVVGVHDAAAQGYVLLLFEQSGPPFQ